MSAPTEMIASAVTATADAITAFGDDLTSPFREREMQDMLVAALATAIVTEGAALTVKPNLGVKFAEWSGVGPVDVSLLDQHGAAAAFLELKWGSNALYNCIWDLPKMSVALALGQAPRAYLIAGAPADGWRTADGAELFGSGVWSVAELLSKYAKHWKFWRGDVKTHPVSLPTTTETQSVTAAPMEVRGEAWELRCVEVVGAGRDWLDVTAADSL